jgi:acyl-CoA thioesterase
MRSTQFDRDIALTPISAGRYHIDISDSWNVMLGPNGGYIAAIILNGMKTVLPDVHTRSITFHFLTASVAGDAELQVDIEKKGRTLSTVTAKLTQGERTIAMAIATLANARENYSFCDLTPPIVPIPNKISATNVMGPDMPGHVPFRDHYDQLLAIGPTPPETSVEASVGGWTRFRENRAFDDLAIVAISDSWFPGLFLKDTPEPVHAPTVDHTVHFVSSVPLASISIDDYLLVQFTTSIAQEGYLIENGWIWSPEGILIAQSRQLAVILPRDS